VSSTVERIFYDSEFTGLHQFSTLISVGFSGASGLEFYAEFADYERAQCDGWIMANVLPHTRWLKRGETGPRQEIEGEATLCLGDSAFVRERLREWLAQFSAVEIWADCPAWDWVLFCQLFGGALNIPRHIFYIPHDLATLFACKGFSADAPRAQFAGLNDGAEDSDRSHNALWDARLVKACHAKLTRTD
jgi:hypothetical protein